MPISNQQTDTTNLKPRTYNLAIGGAGASGLALAYELLQSDYPGKIAIIDSNRKQTNDRTWCFWSKGNKLFPQIIHKSWRHLKFKSEKQTLDLPLSNYQYNCIRGIDFYNYIIPQLKNDTRFDFIYGELNSFQQNDSTWELLVNNELILTDNFANSILSPDEKSQIENHPLAVKQHFVGWKIKFKDNSFNSDSVTLFDIKKRKDGAFAFFYLLPFSVNERSDDSALINELLVEYTLFSKELLPKEEYRDEIITYLNEIGIYSFDLLEEESGNIPMSPNSPCNGNNKNYIRIGIPAGTAKASTGYSFFRAVLHSRAIAKELIEGKPLVQKPITVNPFSTFDEMFLRIIKDGGDTAIQVFEDLFSNNNVEAVFQFLDEESNWKQNLKIMSSVSAWPFISAYFKNRKL